MEGKCNDNNKNRSIRCLIMALLIVELKNKESDQ